MTPSSDNWLGKTVQNRTESIELKGIRDSGHGLALITNTALGHHRTVHCGTVPPPPPTPLTSNHRKDNDNGSNLITQYPHCTICNLICNPQEPMNHINLIHETKKLVFCTHQLGSSPQLN